LKRKLDDHTRLIWAESPGSTTMELQDLDAVSAIAHDAGALVGCDNTWASPLNYKPIEHGVDIVVEALTKFFGGHSDVLMGSVTVTDLEMAKLIRGTLNRYGIGVSPDDCSLVLRGMETMPVRIRHSAEVATRVVSRIEGHPAVRKVLFPSHPDCPGHDIWKRDFLGVTGVFTLQLIDDTVGKVYDALDALETISIGASWGGTRSLIAPMQVRANRTVRPWVAEDCLLRVSIGMESEEEILKDIERLLDLITC
jgi:cystathionine beta-lyase